MRAHRSSPALAAAAAIALCGCGSSRVSITGEVKHGKTAEDNYVAGLAEMKTENWLEATKFMEHVRTKYPFSKYAALAELRLADIKMEQDHNIEAADAFATFVRMHPNHEEADYAAFREGVALLKETPSDFFILPPGHERELKSVQDGANRMEAFIKKYPTSKHRPAAEKLLASARALLAEHEWYAAGFYAKRGYWAGAAGRYEALVKRYPGSSHEVEAFFRLSEARVHCDDRFKARQALQELISKHPDDPRRAEAEQRLAALR